MKEKANTFYPGPSRIHLAAFPPKERWDDWTELDSQAWPRRKERRYSLVPTTCFNCESACGLLAYIDKDTNQVQKFEGNPENPGSRGRNCAKGPATLNQITDPDRILYPLKRAGKRGAGKWERVGWDEVLDTIAARIRKAIVEDRRDEIMYHVGRPGEDGFTERILAHEHLLFRRARRLSIVDGARSAQPRSRECESYLSNQRAFGIRPLLQSARPARDRWQGERRKADRL